MLKDQLALIIISILGLTLAASVGLNGYLVIFNSADIEELTILRFENNATKTELNKYIGLVEAGKTDCDIKLAGAKKIWENNQDVKNDIENSNGGMVTFDLGGMPN